MKKYIFLLTVVFSALFSGCSINKKHIEQPKIKTLAVGFYGALRGRVGDLQKSEIRLRRPALLLTQSRAQTLTCVAFSLRDIKE